MLRDLTCYNPRMPQISRDLENELDRRVADGHYASVDELVRHALAALDESANAERWLEGELLLGLEGEDVVMDDAKWAAMKRESIEKLNLMREHTERT